MRNLLLVMCGPGSGLPKFEQPQGLITCGQKLAQRKAKQQWAIGKPNLDNAQKLRGIFFMEPEDTEFEETMRNAWKKLELPMEAAMSCKVQNHQCGETCGESDTRKSKHACFVEGCESARKRLERILPKDHEDRIARKGFNSLSHYNLVHKFIPVPRAKNIPDAKASVVKECVKLEKLPAWPK